MTKRWIFNDDIDEDVVAQLSREINVDPKIAKILIQRNITDFDQAKIYFRPSLDQLHDPFLMRDMDKALERIKTAMDLNEKILIYGDYDVDGTTSVSLVYGFLKNFYNNIEFYIPDRYKEGYGISKTGIDWAAENKISLLITLDFGIKAVEMTDYANKKDIDGQCAAHGITGMCLIFSFLFSEFAL